MDTRQQRYLYVTKNPGTISTASGQPFDFDALSEGELVFQEVTTGLIQTDLSVAGKYVAVMKGKDGGQIPISPVIDTTKIETVTSAKYSAGSQKVTHVGSNGTTGFFPVGDSQVYNFRIKVRESSKFRFTSRQTVAAGYATGSGATQQEVVTAITKDLAAQTLDKNFKAELIHDDAGDALGTGVGDVVFTKGSNVITATDIDDATVNSALTVGMAIRVGTTVTSPIYIIETIDAVANSATLHMVYQDATGTFDDALLEKIIIADLTAGSFGVQVTTEPDADWKRNQREYEVMDFDIELSGTGFVDSTTALVKQTTPIVYPRGLGKQIADSEFRSRQSFSDGMQNPNDPYTHDDQLNEAVATGLYDTITISAMDDQYLGLGAPSQSFFTVALAVPSLNYTVTIPATVGNAATYTITIDGVVYSFTTDASGTTAELYAGLVAALDGKAIYQGNGTTEIYVSGSVVTVSTGNTDDITVAANTDVNYTGWATMFS